MCVCMWMLVHLGVCLLHLSLPPPPLLNFCLCTSSRGRRKKRQAVVHCLPDRDLVGFPGKEKKHTQRSRGGKSFQQKGLKCLSTAKFGLLIFSNSCCSFIVTNKVNQTNHDAPAANYVLIYCVIATSAAKALCIFAGI